MRTLRLVFICKLFPSRLQAGQLKLYGVSPGLVHVKTIAAFITHVQQDLAETLPSNIRH